MKPRSILATLLVVALSAAAVVAGGAAADKPKTRPHMHKAAAPNSVAASAREIARRFNVVAAADKKIRFRVAAAAAKHRGVIEQKIALSAVADENAVYSTAIVAKATTGHGGGLINIRLLITRIDRTTGAKTELLSKLNTYPIAVYARGGGVVIETARMLPLKKRPKKGEPTLFARIAVYGAKHSDPTLSALSIASVALEPRTEEPCGHFPLVGGISAAGEPLVADVESDCDPKTSPAIENLETNLQVWAADGSRRDLGAVPVASVFFGSQYLLSGSKLLMPSPYEPATSIKDVDGGALSNLWSPSAGFKDIAADGTVALIGVPPDWEDATYAYGRIAKSKPVPPGGVLPPGFPTSDVKVDPPKYPFVLFPQGNADDPVMVAPASSSTAALKFCGANLYAVDSLRGPVSSYEDGGFFDGFSVYGNLETGEFEVRLYDLQGHLVRRLLKTKTITFSSAGCNGDKLLLVARRGNRFSTTEVSP